MLTLSIGIVQKLGILLLVQVVGVNGLSAAGGINRRDALIRGSVAAGGFAGILPEQAIANDNTPAPIAVLGASGRTGALCVASFLSKGIPVRALTRTGIWTPPEGFDDLNTKPLLSVASCDVKDMDALAAGVSGCRGVIYAASASKKGGNPKEIDNDGVVAAGDACLIANVERYVVISSTAVTRPKSLGYIFTDVSVGGIMGEKRKGEDGVKSLYNAAAKSSSSVSSSYAIIRPGGLEEPKNKGVLGPKSLEFSQGDAIAGIISRADLAEVAVEAAISSNNLRNTAFEVYYTDSAQPCERRFKPLLSNGDVQRVHGDSYGELFQGMKPDGEYYTPV